ncbi:hypothetical protein KY329_00510 [Candidatus Woesearchaeota archaeon]|nr:hypothetical protein [Candidatus Woesearchaeota archaeon]
MEKEVCDDWIKKFKENIEVLKSANAVLKQENSSSKLVNPVNEFIFYCITFIAQVEEIRSQIAAGEKPRKELIADYNESYNAIFASFSKVRAVMDEITKDYHFIGSEYTVKNLTRAVKDDLVLFLVGCSDVAKLLKPREIKN